MKFCFVRNPWDRLLSEHYWNLYHFQQLGKKIPESIDESIERMVSNYDIYTINQEVAVDYIGKYENLSQDLAFITQKLGIDWDNWLPKAKAKVRQNRQHYSQVLTSKQIEAIRAKCYDEIVEFNYQFKMK